MRTFLTLAFAFSVVGCSAPDDSPPPDRTPVEVDAPDADQVRIDEPRSAGSVTGKLITRLSILRPLSEGTLVRLHAAPTDERRTERNWDWKKPFRFEGLAAGPYLLESDVRGHVIGVRFEIDGGLLELGHVDVTDAFARSDIVSGMAVRIENAPAAAGEVRLALHHPDWPKPLRRVATVPASDVAPIDDLAPGTYTIEIVSVDGEPAPDVPPLTGVVEQPFSSQLQPVVVIDLAGVRR